ncbi:hypothetical protein H1R20_g8530, partial [Candolleomyces eurysporus]
MSMTPEKRRKVRNLRLRLEADLDPTKVDPIKFSPADVGSTNTGTTNAGPTNVDPTNVGPINVNPTNVGLPNVSLPNVDPTKVGLTNADPTNVAPTKVGLTKFTGISLQFLRQRVTQAQMLGIVPPIPTAQHIGYETTSSIVDADSGAASFEDHDDSLTHFGAGNYTNSVDQELVCTVSSAPGTTSIIPVEVVPGPPLSLAEVQAALIPVISPSVGVGLTAYMNSPKEFFCPNVKCKKQFVVVSALNQHLESGRCGLASMSDEMFDRFGQLTTG